jgi:hypothetical protein
MAPATVAAGKPAAAAPEGHANGEAFRYVVEGDGHDQQDRSLPGARYTFHLLHREVLMNMRQDAIHEEEEESSSQEADSHGHPWGQAPRIPLRHLDRRRQEAPKAGGDHDARGEAEHRIEQLPIKLLEKED